MSAVSVAGIVVFTLAFASAIACQRDIVARQRQGETLASPGTRKAAIGFVTSIAVQIAAFAVVWFAR